MRALNNLYFIEVDRLFFSSKALRLVFSATYLRGSFYPLRIPFDKLRAAASPTDKLRKDSALPPVTSEKSTHFNIVSKTCPVEFPHRGTLIWGIPQGKLGFAKLSVSGHKTRAFFEGYNSVNHTDLK